MRAAKLEIVVATEMSENEKFRNKLSTLEDADHRRQVAAAARESTLGTLEARLRGVRAEAQGHQAQRQDEAGPRRVGQAVGLSVRETKIPFRLNSTYCVCVLHAAV